MAEYTIGQIANALGAEAVGDVEYRVTTISEPSHAMPSELALAMDESYCEDLKNGNAKAAIVWQDADWQSMGLKAAIYAPRSRYALSGISQFFEKPAEIEEGIHPSAVIDPSATLGKNICVGPFVVIGARVKIGDNARIFSHVSISEDAEIGDNALIFQGARIGARIRAGRNLICQPNVVVGSDGFSFVTPQSGAIEEAKKTGTISKSSQTPGFARINSMGTVVIGDNVELGASATIDRGTVANTQIGDGTKIDNLVHIGHNVNVGRNCLLCGQVGIGGSTVINDRVVLGGQVGVADHVTIGSDVIAAGKSGISSNVPPKRVIMGNPAVKMETNIESYKAIRRLPRLISKVAALEKNILKLSRE